MRAHRTLLVWLKGFAAASAAQSINQLLALREALIADLVTECNCSKAMTPLWTIKHSFAGQSRAIREQHR
jgi:hypothetical protein